MSARTERDEARDLLSRWISRGDIVTTFVQHMPRGDNPVPCVRALIIKDGAPFDVSPFAARLLGWRYDPDHPGVKIPEVGTDPGALLVIEMARRLFDGDTRALTHHRL